MFKVIMASALALLLSACGSMPSRIALDPTTKHKIKEVNIINVLSQDEVIVRAESFGATMALGGGLIGAIIDSKVAEGRQNTIQETIAPFYAAVDSYDFRTHFERSLGNSLLNNAAIKFSQIESTGLIPLLQDMSARTNKLKADSGQMYIRTSYTFTSDFTRINVDTYVELRVPGSETPVFKNNFFYQSKTAGTGGADSIKIWSDKMGETYRATMNEATEEITKMLQLDLAASATDPQPLQPIVIAKIDGATKNNISGNLLASSADRKILRNNQGNVYSLPQ